MSKFDSCLVSLDLRDSVPVDALRATAAEYQGQGMEPGAAMQRAVEDQLQLAQMEEAGIVKTVRGKWESQGGAPRPAPVAAPEPASQAGAEVATPAEPKPAPAETAPAPIQEAPEAPPVEEVATPTPEPAPAKKAKPKAPALQARDKKQSAKQKERDTQLADYFAVGNVVRGYGGKFDRVLAYSPAHKDNGFAFSVEVQHVVQQDGDWVADKADDRVRKHSTVPDARELKAGPVERADQQDGELRDLTDQRTIEVDGQRRPIRYTNGELVAPDFMGQVKFWQEYTGETDERGRPIAPTDIRDLSELSPLMVATADEAPKRVATLAKLKAARRQLEEGKITESDFRFRVEQLIGALEDRNASKADPKPRERGPEWITERLMRARRTGELDPATVNFALWALSKNPALAEDMGISLRTPNERGTAGQYNPVSRVITLFKGTENAGTAVHEILHHTERMMPEQVQAGIIKAWQADFSRAYQGADDTIRAALDDMLIMAFDKAAAERVMKAFGDGVLDYDMHYQLSNASEYWAVNATRIMGDRFKADSWVAQARQWLSELVQKVRGWLSLKSDSAVLAGLQAVMDGTGERVSPRMLVERGARVSEFTLRDLSSAIGNGIQAASLQELPGKVANRLSDFRNVGLQFLGRRQLVDLYADQFKPEGRESVLARYSNLMQQMDADKNEAGAEADGIADRWGKLKDADRLADLMHDATLARIDPSKPHIVGDNAAEHGALQRRYNALSPEGQAIYREARDAYHTHWQKVRTEIRSRIERAMPDNPRRAALLEKMDATFYEQVRGVYFPLARFGEYVVTVSDANGARLSVNFAETTNEAEALRRELLRKFPVAGGHVVSKITKKKEFNPGRDAVSRGFMQELFGVLDQYEDSAELQDDINQLYLSSMPDLSWAKHGIHRKGTPGYSQDARRAFAQNMFHGARYLAKLRYGDRLADFLDEMQDHVDAQAAVADYDSVRAQQVVDEMNKRHEAYMNPKGNSLSSTLTSIGFIFYLGLSPASAVVNLTQTPLVTLPMLAAKHGFAKASAALLTAAKQAAGSKNDISRVLAGDELRAYQQAVDAGVIDVSMAHDLAGIASGDDTKAHAKLRPVMKWASFMFHHGEKFNRQASLLAAYRLAREAGGNHDAAYKAAVEDVYASHFDYSSGNRPRVMQGNVARVVLLFKQYSQNMIYTLTRNAALAAKGDKVAQKTLAGLLISHAMAAGVLGLPVVGTLLSAATMLGSDEDEPWDAKVALRNYIADLIGQKPAEVMMHGFSRLGPFDISGRVGLDKLILPDIQEGLEGARAAESWMTAALGPVAGIGISATKGLAKMAEGQYMRGLEDMLPVSVRNPIKALRLHSEGVKDKSGIPILDDTSAVEEIGQLLGFSPSRSREAMEGKSAVYRAERRLLDRRQALVEQWSNAKMAGDDEGAAEVREAIKVWNSKQPARRITMPNLVQSLRGRNKRIREAEGGVYLPKKHRDVRDLGRFAEQD